MADTRASDGSRRQVLESSIAKKFNGGEGRTRCCEDASCQDAENNLVTVDVFTPEFPLISCVMPTYGRPGYVNEAVAMFLAQDYSHKELIIFNDCPDQRFLGNLPGVRIVNCDQRFSTLGDKRNACIEAARGSLIAVWDDDDVYLPWRLSYSFAEMRRHQTPFYRAADFWAYWGDAALQVNRSVPGWVNHPNTLFTKSLWQDAGQYPSQGVGEDAVLFARIHQQLQQEFIKYPLHPADRFFILRGASEYAHMSMAGGRKPLDLTPGEYQVEPAEISDPILRTACERLIQTHRWRSKSRSIHPELSICISVKNRSRLLADGLTLELFPNCVLSLVEAVRDWQSVELIIADFHSDDWPLHEWLQEAAGDLAYQVISIDGPFSKGKGLNRAATAATSQRLLFLDADMLANRTVLQRAVDVIDSGNIWLPICRHLDQFGQFAEWGDFGVGNIAFSRTLWESAGPVPEFQSWGGEDNIFADQAQRLCVAVRERCVDLRHQWHPESWRHQHYARPAKADFENYSARQLATDGHC